MYLLEAVSSSREYVFRWIQGTVRTLISDIGFLHHLLPLFVIGIAISAIFLGIKIIRSLTWGS